MTEFESIVSLRYATKRFDGQRVPDIDVQKLLELVRLAPSSLNLQPWHIFVVTDEETKRKLQPHSYNQIQITSCSHLLVLCARTDLEAVAKEVETILGPGHDQFVGMISGFLKSLPQEQRLPWAQRQLYIALGNALNGAKALGFDSCPMEGFNSAAYKEVLEIPDHYVPTVLCPIGYGADEPRPKLRFLLTSIVTEK